MMTFTKLFASITESTVWCESHPVRIVWITMLAMANKNGCVFASVPGLANRARVTVDEANEALGKFTSPDPYSRTEDFEGRRVEVIDGGWKLLNYDKYRALRNEEERRDYMRNLMRAKRTSLADVSNVSRRKPGLSQAEAEAEADKEKPKSKARALRAFVPPTLEEVKAYCQERKNQVDPDKFHAYYTSQGWYVGKNRMKDWRAAVRTWERNNFGGEFHGGYQRPSVSKNQQRVINNRAAILTGLGIGPKSGQCEPSVQDGDVSGRDPDMAVRFLKGKS